MSKEELKNKLKNDLYSGLLNEAMSKISEAKNTITEEMNKLKPEDVESKESLQTSLDEIDSSIEKTKSSINATADIYVKSIHEYIEMYISSLIVSPNIPVKVEYIQETGEYKGSTSDKGTLEFKQ